MLTELYASDFLSKIYMQLLLGKDTVADTASFCKNSQQHPVSNSRYSDIHGDI